MSPKRVALLTEGDAEFKALPHILPQLNALSPFTVVKPLKVNVQPDASAGMIARGCKSRVLIAQAQGADLVVIVLDREQQDECPGLLASNVEAALGPMCSGVTVRVVYKDRLFENWLVADMSALAAQPGRFQVTPARRKRVEPNKADHVDALNLMKEMAIGKDYQKVNDAERVCRHMSVSTAATHSRSLRHLLHVLGVPAYSGGCKAAKRP